MALLLASFGEAHNDGRLGIREEHRETHKTSTGPKDDRSSPVVTPSTTPPQKQMRTSLLFALAAGTPLVYADTWVRFETFLSTADCSPTFPPGYIEFTNITTFTTTEPLLGEPLAQLVDCDSGYTPEANGNSFKCSDNTLKEGCLRHNTTTESRLVTTFAGLAPNATPAVNTFPDTVLNRPDVGKLWYLIDTQYFGFIEDEQSDCATHPIMGDGRISTRAVLADGSCRPMNATSSSSIKCNDDGTWVEKRGCGQGCETCDEVVVHHPGVCERRAVTGERRRRVSNIIGFCTRPQKGWFVGRLGAAAGVGGTVGSAGAGSSGSSNDAMVKTTAGMALGLAISAAWAAAVLF
ncbi:uncharacterized protein EV422DRAFT_569319 [Fimicolochytrium jonesii]|uniref:uncharacterized protein n=1 Tax=Fimicolochytrium jonesii TaxID=1396493 RepID=UPI0022FDE058|nr:uncharacterized protein EV422DRAFT_569319 [Fimicolochytrium jonesii]KAI8819044.1 hypothetical protein EV422DRAFT_569319 [Fimicolochytrium jonesii]